VLPPAGGGVWVNDFLDWLWCVVADVVVVWEGSVVVPHHPSYHNLPATQHTTKPRTVVVVWLMCGSSGGEVVWRVGEEVLRDKETKGGLV